MIPNPEQDVRAFLINCYKKLYRQGKLSGQGIARHNELVDDYTKKFNCSTMTKIKMTKRIRKNIKTNTNKWFMKRRYDNFNGHEVNVFCGLYQPSHNRSDRTMKYVRMVGCR